MSGRSLAPLFYIATYMDNDVDGILQAFQKSVRPVKCVRARKKGKEGGLRDNLMGERVDFSAHTVIMDDPNMELDEVGVPKNIAMSLAYPECGESNRTYVGSLFDSSLACGHSIQHCVLTGAGAEWSDCVSGCTTCYSRR